MALKQVLLFRRPVNIYQRSDNTQSSRGLSAISHKEEQGTATGGKWGGMRLLAATGQGGKQEAIGRDYEWMLRDIWLDVVSEAIGLSENITPDFFISFFVRALATELT